MKDHESTDLAGAAELAGRHALPPENDRPSRQELREDQMEIDRAVHNRPRVYYKGWEMSRSAAEEDTR